jgi:hypothetical protein
MFAAAAAAVATFVTAFITAISLAVVDLYLTGHSRPSLMRPLIDRPALGISISFGDIILLLLPLATGTVVGTLLWRRGR